VRLPKRVDHRQPQVRRDLASSLRNLGLDSRGPRTGRAGRSNPGDDDQLQSLRAALRRHPVHGCDDREAHMRWAERWVRLRHDTDALEHRVAGKTGSIARTFDRVCSVLTELGYLADDEVTDAGHQLARVYSETDLLVVECLRTGAWDGLGPAELAAVVSSLVYSARRPEGGAVRVPSGAVEGALAEVSRLWARLADLEGRHKVELLREPDPGFAAAAYAWASGAGLDTVLGDGDELTAGDFVRWCKQLLDLLGQIADIAPAEVRGSARKAVTAVRRGVVAYTSVT
jgi:ATP-dependent RNA helicase HelY